MRLRSPWPPEETAHSQLRTPDFARQKPNRSSGRLIPRSKSAFVATVGADPLRGITELPHQRPGPIRSRWFPLAVPVSPPIASPAMDTVTFRVEVADLKAFQRRVSRTSPAVRRMRIFIGGMFLVLSFLQTSRRDYEGWGEWLIHFIAVFALMAGVGSLLIFGINRLAEIGAFRGAERHGVLGEHTITLTPEGLHEQTAVNESKTAWRGIHRIDATKDHLFIFLQPAMAHVIPRRAFPTPADADAFLAKARDYFAAAQPG
jgi:hypothetical protein